MISLQDAQTRLIAANPVPTPQALPDEAWSPELVLDRFEQRRETMTDLDTPATQLSPALRKKRPMRGPLAAAVAALVVVAVGVLMAFAALTGDEDVPARSEVELAQEWLAHQAAGDLAAWESMIHPEATWGPDGPAVDPTLLGRYFDTPAIRELNALTAHYVAATGAVVDATCESVGEKVRCERVATSGLAPGAVIARAVAVIDIEDGLVVDARWSGQTPGPTGDVFGLSQYRQWVMSERADVFETLFTNGATIAVDTPEVRQLHRQTIDEFLAARAGS